MWTLLIVRSFAILACCKVQRVQVWASVITEGSYYLVMRPAWWGACLFMWGVEFGSKHGERKIVRYQLQY